MSNIVYYKYNAGPKKSSEKPKELKNLPRNFVLFIIILIGSLVLIQIFRWQVLEGEKFSTMAKSQYLETQRSSSGRGSIYGLNGSVLAIDEPSWGVYATLSNDKTERELFFSNKDKFIAEVAGILGITKDEISSKITDDFVYFPISHGVTTEKKKALEEAEIFGKGTQGFGLYFEKEEKRLYPDGKLASHILGFIGKNEKGEDVGLYGIEGYYFGDLTGREGYSYEEKDSQGNVIFTVEYSPVLPRQGKDITLTIDPAIQSKVEDIIKEGVHKFQAKSGTVIIMNPQTGAIIAMANYPDYNPNEYWKTSDSSIFRNKAVADVYEYGSVQKPISLAIALESKKVSPDYICNDQTGSMKLYDKTIYTWNKQPTGLTSLSQILEKSQNVCVADVALKVGFEYYYPKLTEFGFGQFIGIGLQDESNSYLKPYEEWTKLDLATSSFGQGISATPLQVISALSTIANKGVRMRPYIVADVKDEKEEIKYTPQEIARPISEDTAKLVASYMGNVVLKGEPKRFFAENLPDYSIAGKTGTAQVPKPDEAGYYTDRTNTTFVGFSPVENAKMIMLVKLEEPKIDQFAATTAVPVWIEIFKAIANDLEIPKK